MGSSNLNAIQSLYDGFARGDIPAVLAAMSPDIVWMEAENFPYDDGNPYVGHDAVVAGVFMRCATEWDGFAVTPEQLLDAGDHIVARGRYTGTYKATGKPIRAQFCHVWKLEGGKAVTFQQYIDTFQVRGATGG